MKLITDRLVGAYRKHVARLRKTGGGIDDPDKAEDPNGLGTLTIGPDGPDETTEPGPRNIWGMLYPDLFVNFY